ncbi:LAG1-domain-containing protein [Teratosphaeria nubilosa]|uniref:LAG1-domain-containing protein n=1 Tax=Teratosphaeria nubilosa TaxID=161662 RepID=A0A6G1LE27_9PEZI|nr:LAG1-domain-containing protein [Teratosphaeria nubilosa]
MDGTIHANGLHQQQELYTPLQKPTYEGASLTGLSICASPGDQMAASPKRRRTKERDESIGSMIRKGIVDHQLGIAINLMLFVGFAYVLFPSLREKLTAFFTLSYPVADGGMYGQGTRDLYLVGSFIVFFTALRAFSLDYALMPLAAKCGIKKRKGKVRFAEQTYMMIYYVLYWSWGFTLFVQDTPEDVDGVEGLLMSMWRDYPRLHLNAGMKLYYLSQLAFWIQQVMVIHIEEMRKDHVQMLTHHIITIGLLSFSYPYRQWRVGNAVLVCMDIVDFIFPLAKILKYLEYQKACDAAFGCFVIFWLASRHIAYNMICWSIWAHVNENTMPYGLYSTKTGQRISENGGTNVIDNLLQPILHPHAQTVSFNANIRWLFLGLLGALQCITIAWFLMICRVVAKVLRGQGADDTRSDDEGAEAEAEDEIPQPSDHRSVPIVAAELEKPKFIEVEANGDELSYVPRHQSRGTATKRKSKGISSGLNLGDHKEILNRIGCLSEEQLAREREKREDSVSPRIGGAGGGGGRK